jgi:hypothetical protein
MISVLEIKKHRSLAKLRANQQQQQPQTTGYSSQQPFSAHGTSSLFNNPPASLKWRVR